MQYLCKLVQIQINGSRLQGSTLFPYCRVEGKSEYCVIRSVQSASPSFNVIFICKVVCPLQTFEMGREGSLEGRLSLLNLQR